MTHPLPRTPAVTVILLWLLVYTLALAATLNNTTPYQGDETYYAGSAIRMVRTGDVAIPVYSGQPRFQKPILPYWITALGYLSLGVGLWSGRIGFLLLALGVLALVHRVAARNLQDQRACLLAVLAVASSTLFIEHARVSMTDLPLAFFSLLALHGFSEAIRRPEQSERYGVLGFAATGLACASKGALGVLPLLAGGAAAFTARPLPPRRVLLLFARPLNWLAFAVPALGWYAWVSLGHGGEVIRQLETESARNTVAGPLGLAGHLLFYPGAALACCPLAALALGIALRRRQSMRGSPRVMVWYLGLTSAVLALVVKGNHARYLLPALPVLGVLAADVLTKAGWTTGARRLAMAWASAQLFALLLFPAVVGEPIRQLTGDWERLRQGPLTSYRLPPREQVWVEALSHGRALPYDPAIPFVIVQQADADDLAPYDVVRQEDRLRRIGWAEGRIVTVRRTFLLVRRRLPPGDPATRAEPGPPTPSPR